jgi:hypothetical protein
MPDIPTRPELIKNKKVNVKQDTSTGVNVAPKTTFSMPYVGGDAAIGVVDNISKLANKVADTDAKDKAFRAGQEREREAQKQGKTTLTDKLLPSWTISGAAYEEGQNTAFLNAKEIEISTKMTEWKTDYKLDAQGFADAAKEYEKELLASLPERMQNPVFMAYEKQTAAVGAEINANIVDENRIKNINDQSILISQKTNTVRNAILTNADAEVVMELLIDAKNEIDIKLPTHQVTSATLAAEVNAFRKNIFDALLESEWNRSSTDAKTRKKLLDSVLNGSWKGDLDTKDLSAVFPKGMELTVEEAEYLKQKILKLNKDYGTASTNLKTKTVKDYTDAIEDNKSGGTIKQIILSDANSIDHGDYTRWESEHDKERYRANLEAAGATQFELDQFERDWNNSILIGTSAFQGFVVGRGTNQANALANQYKNNIEKIKATGVGQKVDGKVLFNSLEEKEAMLSLAEDQQAAFLKSQDILTTAITEGSNASQVLIDEGIINFTSNDYNEAGINKLKEEVASTLNIQVDMVNVIPKELVDDFARNFNQAGTGVEVNQYIQEAYTLYGKTNTYQILQKLTKNSEKVEDDALLALLAVYKPDQVNNEGMAMRFNNADAELLSGSIKAYSNNLVNLDSYATVLSDLTGKTGETALEAIAQEEFSDGEYGFLKGTLSTAQTQSYKAMYKTLMARFINTTRGDIERSKQLTSEFIQKNFFIGDIAEGVTIMASRNDIPGTGAVWSEYQSIYAAVKNDPLGYGGVSANLDTIDEVESNFEDFVVSFANGKMTFFDERGLPVMMSHITQAGDDIYSEFTIQPYSKVEGNVEIDAQLQNQADEIKYSHTAWSEKFEELKEVSFEDEANITQVEMRVKTINEKMSEANVEFRKWVAMMDGIDPENVEYNETYEALLKSDFAVRELTNDTKEQNILVMVSHAVSTGDMQPWMLQWIGNYIPYGENAKFVQNRVEIMKVLNDPDKHELFKSGLVDKGNTGSIQTPLQYLFSIIREQPENPYSEEMAPDLGTEFEITGS